MFPLIVQSNNETNDKRYISIKERNVSTASNNVVTKWAMGAGSTGEGTLGLSAVGLTQMDPQIQRCMYVCMYAHIQFVYSNTQRQKIEIEIGTAFEKWKTTYNARSIE